MKQTNHVHRFKRHTYKTGGQIYYCINDCNFRVAVEFALGKLSECNRCGKPFRMNKYSITLDKPHCEECHIHKDSRKGKRKNFGRREGDQPLAKVSNAIGDNLVEGLRERLGKLTDESQLAVVKSEDKPTEEEKENKTVEIREFQIDEADDFL